VVLWPHETREGPATLALVTKMKVVDLSSLWYHTAIRHQRANQRL